MRGPRLLATALVALLLASCGEADWPAAPGCDPDPRSAILAQSVPGAAYVPCIEALPAGWDMTAFEVSDDGATITLESDRADRVVEVELVDSCDVTDATPIAPSDEGVRTYNQVTSIDPRYAGRLLDVFAGGCVVTSYDFERGPHVALVTELRAAVGLLSRRELEQALDADLGITLDP